MSSNKSIIIKYHSYPDKSENYQKIDGVDHLNIGVFKVEEKSDLHQNNLVAVVSFWRNVLSVYQRNRVAVVK